MRNTSEAVALAAVALAMCALPARAQQLAQGFAVERLHLAAPGNRWFVMDDLSWPEGLGGAVSLSLGYAHRPLVIQSLGPAQSLAVIEHQAFADLGLAVSYDRFRLYTHFSSPLRVAGQSGTVGGFQFTGPSTNLEQNPDTISDAQLGFDARLFGNPRAPLRLGVDAELIFPSGTRADYLTDDTYRMAARALFAGDAGSLSYAAHLGLHVRPLDESPAPGGPRGTELLFGAATGARLGIGGNSLLVGPEIYWATAFRSVFGSETTALEALLTGRFEGRGPYGGRLGIKLGLGVGIHAHFGAPEWRAVIGVDLRGQAQLSNEDAATSH